MNLITAKEAQKKAQKRSIELQNAQEEKDKVRREKEIDRILEICAVYIQRAVDEGDYLTSFHYRESPPMLRLARGPVANADIVDEVAAKLTRLGYETKHSDFHLLIRWDGDLSKEDNEQAKDGEQE